MLFLFLLYIICGIIVWLIDVFLYPTYNIKGNSCIFINGIYLKITNIHIYKRYSFNTIAIQGYRITYHVPKIKEVYKNMLIKTKDNETKKNILSWKFIKSHVKHRIHQY